MSFSSWDDVSTTTGIVFRLFVGLDLLQDLQAADLRQFQIEQHDRRVVGGARAEFPPAVEIIQSLLSVAGNHDLICQVIVLQRRQGQLDVVRIVLDDQNACK